MPYRYTSIGVGLLCMTVAAIAQETSLSDPGNESAEKRDPHPKLLVSTFGKIVEGRISHSASGYIVDVEGGSFLIPFKMVKFTADSRHDAYLKYKKLMPEETADNHVVLAKWCIDNQLLSDASHELKQALYLEPSRNDAAQLFAYVERLKNGYQQLSTRSGESSSSNTPSAVPKQAVSLNGLSPKTVSEYSSAIQPILVNNCAKAGCHHAEADNNLQLRYVRLTGYGNRLATASNLAEVLKQLDTKTPSESPLLVRARSNHGQARQTLVTSPKGKEILDRLENWIETATGELNPSPDNTLPTAPEPAESLHQSPRGRTIDRESLPKDEREFVQQILSQQKLDPFDPAQFNRSDRPSGN